MTLKIIIGIIAIVAFFGLGGTGLIKSGIESAKGLKTDIESRNDSTVTKTILSDENTKRRLEGTIRDSEKCKFKNKNKKCINFAGFNSAQSQEETLREELRKNQKLYPEFFKGAK